MNTDTPEPDDSVRNADDGAAAPADPTVEPARDAVEHQASDSSPVGSVPGDSVPAGDGAEPDDRGVEAPSADEQSYAVEPVDPRSPIAASARSRVLAGVLVVVVTGLLGFPLGWLWSTVAPWLPVQVSGGELFYADPEGEQRAGAESWFIILSLATGIVFAVVAWFALRRFRGSVMTAALAIGSVITGWLAWRFGHTIGRGHVLRLARHATSGQILRFPPELRIKSTGNIGHWHGLPYLSGDLLYVAVAAVAVYVVLVLVSVTPSLGLRSRS